MISDNLFLQSKPGLRKIALLLTIPCAILPMLMAAMGMMTHDESPLFFQHETYLFLLIYIGYAYGLGISWQAHRNLIPLSIFIAHIGMHGLFYYNQQDYSWITYMILITLILTSVLNQYYRIGTIACSEECTEKI